MCLSPALFDQAHEVPFVSWAETGVDPGVRDDELADGDPDLFAEAS